MEKEARLQLTGTAGTCRGEAEQPTEQPVTIYADKAFGDLNCPLLQRSRSGPGCMAEHTKRVYPPCVVFDTWSLEKEKQEGKVHYVTPKYGKPFRYSPERRIIRVEGQRLHRLSQTSASLLDALIEANGEMVTNDELYDRSHDDESKRQTWSVSMEMNRLVHALTGESMQKGRSRKENIIASHYGKGYSLPIKE